MEIDFKVLHQKLRQGAAIAEPLKRCLEDSFPARLPRQRLRAPPKEKLLIKLDLARRDRLLAGGELIRLGPSHWRWRITELASSGE
jgi:hypothetical protein